MPVLLGDTRTSQPACTSVHVFPARAGEAASVISVESFIFQAILPFKTTSSKESPAALAPPGPGAGTPSRPTL